MRTRPLIARTLLAFAALTPVCALAAPGLPGGFPSWAEGRLVGGAPGGAAAGAGFAQGPTLELGLGGAVPVGDEGQPSRTGWAGGAALGYQLPNGWEPLARFEVLGTQGRLIDFADLRFVVVGARYALPFWWVAPFVEVLAGLDFVEATTLLGPVEKLGAGAGVAVGLLVPLGRHFAVGVAARDWGAQTQNGFVQAFEVQGFLQANFGLLFRR